MRAYLRSQKRKFRFQIFVFPFFHQLFRSYFVRDKPVHRTHGPNKQIWKNRKEIFPVKTWFLTLFGKNIYGDQENDEQKNNKKYI
jgi:hypothetical protein